MWPWRPGQEPQQKQSGHVENVVRLAEGSGPTLTIGGAPVVKPDVMASNGVIHGISSVLLPTIVPV